MSGQSSSRTTAPGGEATTNHGGARSDEPLALVVAWSSEEPERIGEVAFLPASKSRILGRGSETEVVTFQRQRPGEARATGPLQGTGISRRQLVLRPRGDAVLVERVGRCPLRVNGQLTDKTVVVAGDTLLLRGQVLLLVTTRPTELAPFRSFPSDILADFGHVDALGILGESPAVHRLRDQIGFAARTGRHVLVRGESGTGKELTARALHALSSRRDGPFLARNAATFPEGLIDTELFGNVKDYPNPGMVARNGLIGEADGGTLFLDEVGDLPQHLQSHLLRVLDNGGDYQRLGESKPRRADFRLVGATHREVESLRLDFAARLAVRVAVPPLDARREDIPLLVRHLLRRAEVEHPDLLAGFERDDAGVVRVAASLMEHLLRCDYPGNVRELEALLWQAVQNSEGGKLGLTDEMRTSRPPDDNQAVERESPGPEALREAIASSGGNLARAAKLLGLSSRFALYRLLRKHGIDVRDARG